MFLYLEGLRAAGITLINNLLLFLSHIEAEVIIRVFLKSGVQYFICLPPVMMSTHFFCNTRRSSAWALFSPHCQTVIGF